MLTVLGAAYAATHRAELVLRADSGCPEPKGIGSQTARSFACLAEDSDPEGACRMPERGITGALNRQQTLHTAGIPQ
jgi:hypothetical protein